MPLTPTPTAPRLSPRAPASPDRAIDAAAIAQAEAAANRASAEAAVEQLRAAAIGQLPTGSVPTDATIAAGETLQTVFGNAVYRAAGRRVDLPVADVFYRLRAASFPGMAKAYDSGVDLPETTVRTLSFHGAGTAAHTPLLLRYAVVPDGATSLVKVEVTTSWRPGRFGHLAASDVLNAQAVTVSTVGATAWRTHDLTKAQITAFVAALNTWLPAPPVNPTRHCPLAPDTGSRLVLQTRHWAIALTPQSCSGSVVVTTTPLAEPGAIGQPTPTPIVSYLQDWGRVRDALNALGIR